MVSKQFPNAELTDQQMDFVRAYALRPNATKAALAAGYSDKCPGETGYYLLTLTRIREAVAEERKRLGVESGISKQMVLEELRRVAFADLKRFAEWDEEGNVKHRSSADLNDSESAAIREIKSEKKTRRYKQGESETTATVELKLHDKTKALAMLCSLLGFETQKVNAFEVKISPEDARKIIGMDFATQPDPPTSPVKDL